jgi:hypothetical protein
MQSRRPGLTITLTTVIRSLRLLGLLLAARSAAAQTVPWPARELRIVDSVRLDTKKAQISGRDLPMALRADGSIAILGRGPELFYVDSTGRYKWSRKLWPDMRFPNALSWKGDSIYVIDNATDQMLAVGSNGGVGDIVDFPDIVRPPFKNRRSLPAYGALDVAVIIDSTLIGTGRTPRSMGMYGPKTKQDPTRVPVLRTNFDGIVQVHLATVVNAPRGDVWSILPDGRLTVFRTDKDSLAFIGISPRGDTTFSRRLPKVRAVFSNAVGGNDGSIWVSTSIGSNEFYHTLFDANGKTLGRLVLANYLRVTAGDARHVWVVDTRGQERKITRYTVKPR